MKIACMQPYFLPYIGYWQLLSKVDKFFILDDVQYIVRGWINRNKIILNGEEQWFTLPLVGASRSKNINEINICLLQDSLPKMRKTLQCAYGKSPFFRNGMQLFEEIMSCQNTNLADFLAYSIRQIASVLGIQTDVIMASQVHSKHQLKGQDRILALCENQGASCYVNPIGGVDLYDDESFENKNISLNFLYSAYDKELLPFSILDAIMRFDLKEIQEYLNQCSLVQKDFLQYNMGL